MIVLYIILILLALAYTIAAENVYDVFKEDAAIKRPTSILWPLFWLETLFDEFTTKYIVDADVIEDEDEEEEP